jgi:UDP-4-amino-4,6-dideoxy-N-acetyl-beta-L-altrosamine transaminase
VKPLLPYARQWIGPEDVRAVAEALRSDRLTQGPRVERFERAFARTVGARHAVAVSSGTAGLHAACRAAGLGPGDEAIVPAITFVATANAVRYTGAVPKLCDVDPETATLDVASAERLVGPRTRAILPVDYAGHPCDLQAVRRLARRHGLWVIEDAAHALGARYRGRPVGALSDLTVFSFHPVKHITTGEGGMVTTDSAVLAERMRRFRHHGIIPRPDRGGPWDYEVRELGCNYRLTDLQCALGASQLRKLGAFVRARRRLAALYRRRLAGLQGVALPVERPWARHSYHLFPIRLKADRRRVFEVLRRRRIGVQVHYIPLHHHPLYREPARRFPGAERFYRSVLSLPLFPEMRRSDVERVVDALRGALRRRSA